MTPVLSVVIPAYNAAEFLAATVRSVLAQTMPGVEVVIVDDGSTDGTAEVAASFADRPRVTVLSQANTGVTEARNAGLGRARGRYVAFLDADDLWHPQKAERHCAVLARRPDVDLTWSDWCIIDTLGRDTGRRSASGVVPSLEALVLENFTGCPGTVITRRSAVEEVEGFDPSSEIGCEDLDLWLRIAGLRDGNMAHVPGVLTAYRRRFGQRSGDWVKKQRAWNAVVARAAKRWPARVGAVEHAGRARFLAYLAHLNIECGDYPTALKLMLCAWRQAPLALTTDWRAWRRSVAVLAGLILSQRQSRSLRDRIYVLMRYHTLEPRPLEWADSAGLPPRTDVPGALRER